MPVTVTVNGADHAVATGATVAQIVASLGAPATGVAVAVNDAVLPRAEWPSTGVQAGDRIEVLTATQGG